jgi:fluoroquinolone resistance protein
MVLRESRKLVSERISRFDSWFGRMKIDLEVKEFEEFSFNSVYQKNELFLDKSFIDCKFYNCDFSESKFEKCRFVNCIFEECNLSLIKLTDSQIRDVSFKDCKLIGIDWTICSMNLFVVKFEKCILDYCNFNGLNLQNLVITDCKVIECDFTQTNLFNSDFKGSDLDRAIFSKSNLSHSDMRGAVNFLIDPRINNLKNAQFNLGDAIGLLRSFDIIIN